MDRIPCHVVYVDRAVGEDRLVRSRARDADGKLDRVGQLVQPLLDAFGDVFVCATGEACLAKLIQLQDRVMTDPTPTLVLLDTPHDDAFSTLSSPVSPTSPLHAEPPSPPGGREIRRPDEELYGLTLLQKLVTEAHLRNVSKLIIPVPVLGLSDPAAAVTGPMTDGAVETSGLGLLYAHRPLLRKCLDIGAVDVIISPLSAACIATLEMCAYKARRDATREQQALLEFAKGRKRSWVGVNEQKPYAYLREAMVSGLMRGICRLDHDDGRIAGAHIAVSLERQTALALAVGSWHFCAHSFTDDELLVAAMLMFKHALAMPELEVWRVPTKQLISFLVACRAAYNTFVPYHNFRHVVDVLQATFNFLVHIGTLPPYPRAEEVDDAPRPESVIGRLLTPFEGLTLLITAIGHDVGHPGVNNGFLSTLNAPLAQLYNDRSVLESFHCAAYSQILRRYWPAVFEDRKMRNLMISSILSTDMGLHFDYMRKLGDLQDRLRQDPDAASGWNVRQVDEHKVLACSLLIKCADISNVARQHDAALQWMHILSEEFSRQASMEDELEIKSSLLAPPKKDMASLAKAQLGFMNLFAIPLFQGVADIVPAMRYTVDELEINKRLFEQKLEEAKAPEEATPSLSSRGGEEDPPSPRTKSFARSQDTEKAGVNGSTMLDDVERQDGQPLPFPSGQASEPPDLSGTKQVPLSVDAIRELAADGDPFRCRADSCGDSKICFRQRCSETTEGSISCRLTNDWQSQDTTGQQALSPSTQGTSIVSNESLERTVSGCGPDGWTRGPNPQTVATDVHVPTLSAPVPTPGKTVKKRPSRFRMKDFALFRKNKGNNSPTLPAADATN
ncbi:hypothetical protein CDD80_4210 [Ophiocordyceps camponoti-rufipedis]|uniref:Phosphodiesterase n=1 Tax=Ophiocordyceps camponoti-rufipedis TaxID=2004952 RepID=A0A2C5Z0L8_9HYPO|nr:hypothetical protein CDD80_4210 [Ophiocordyceps camponoti-rufipedis]